MVNGTARRFRNRPAAAGNWSRRCRKQWICRTCIAKTAIAYTRLVLSHDATLEEMLPSLQQENLRLQQQMGKVLTLAGYPEDYLDTPFTCPLCRDTGFDQKGERCVCYQKLVRELTAQEFNKNSPMKSCSFEDFKLEYYPEGARENMGKVLLFCRRYSQDFSLSSPSLLMMGATGLGKSHLSLSIAGEVVKKGYMVLNGSVQDLFGAVQSEYYGRGQSDISTMDSMRQADLLVLDDLGSEYDTPFQNSTLFSILNYRLEQQKPTIISTNLSFQDIQRRYSAGGVPAVDTVHLLKVYRGGCASGKTAKKRRAITKIKGSNRTPFSLGKEEFFLCHQPAFLGISIVQRGVARINKKKRFLFNSLLMSVTSVLVSGIGVWFSLAVSSAIGQEAMGVFQLIMSVVSFGSTFACSGIQLAAARLTAKKLGEGKEGALSSRRGAALLTAEVSARRVVFCCCCWRTPLRNFACTIPLLRCPCRWRHFPCRW